MRFLVQKSDVPNRVVSDFKIALSMNENFYSFKRDKIDIFECYFKDLKKIASLGEVEDLDCLIPIGDIDFVLEALKVIHNIDISKIKPLNVPLTMQDEYFTKRKFYSFEDLKELDSTPSYRTKVISFYVKSDKFKDPLNGRYPFKKTLKNFGSKESSNFQISTYLKNIKSEWRVFVFNNRILDVRNYAGDFFLMPDKKLLEEITEKYSKQTAKTAFSFDVGIFKNKTFLIEMHDFFSLDFYGFSDYYHIPLMFERCFLEVFNRFKGF